MSHVLPWLFAGLAALSVGVIVISFWQSVRGALGLIGTDEVAEERFADRDRDLLSRRAAVLTALRDLDFDHEAGKLSDEDHREARAMLRAEAKVVMKAIDDVVAPHRAKAEALFDERAGSTGIAPAATASAPSETPASDAASSQTASSTVCPSCETENDGDAAFCKRCGKPLAHEARS